jgi:HPt (histidine-containing phosphotransfer) domain-containing protein
MMAVLAMFHTVSEQLRDQIRQGFSSGSLEAVADAAHKLKSNARSIGAFAFGATCADLEEAAEAGNADGVRLRIAPFEAELAALCLYLASTAPADLRSVDGRRR